MKEIIRKLNTIKDELLNEKGSLLMFVLIERNDTEGKWDLLLSANWIPKTNNQSDLIYIINKLKKEFKENLEFLSQIVIGTPTDSFILRIARAIDKQNIELSEEIFDLQVSPEFTIHRLYVIAMNFTDMELASEGVEEEGPIAVREASEF